VDRAGEARTFIADRSAGAHPPGRSRFPPYPRSSPRSDLAGSLGPLPDATGAPPCSRMRLDASRCRPRDQICPQIRERLIRPRHSAFSPRAPGWIVGRARALPWGPFATLAHVRARWPRVPSCLRPCLSTRTEATASHTREVSRSGRRTAGAARAAVAPRALRLRLGAPGSRTARRRPTSPPFPPLASPGSRERSGPDSRVAFRNFHDHEPESWAQRSKDSSREKSKRTAAPSDATLRTRIATSKGSRAMPTATASGKSALTSAISSEPPRSTQMATRPG
jgi:hypothetical protein